MNLAVSIPETPSNASINRVMVADLPGIPIDAEVKGKKAYHLLSSLALIAYARQYQPALKLPIDDAQDTEQARREIPRMVNDYLQAPDPERRMAAQSIAIRLGRNLGHILLTLHRGDTVNQEARPDWSTKEWAHWATISRVYLGGGMMSGTLGEYIAHHAREFLADIACSECPEVQLTPYPIGMATVGAGRYLPSTTRHALCFDFGHTLAKRTQLTYTKGTLTQLHTFSPIPTPWSWHNDPAAKHAIEPRDVLAFVVHTVTQTLKTSQSRGVPLDPNLMLSVAAYVHGGQLGGNGVYATMNHLAEDVGALLTQAIREHTGQQLTMHLIHDGTAAATVHAGKPNTAVLVIGTAIGVGFPPTNAQSLRPVDYTILHQIQT